MIGYNIFEDLYTAIRDNDGILGLNERNLTYIRPNNKKSARRIADNKLITKKILNRNNIKNPQIYGQIRNITELNNFNWSSLPKSFVLKPKKGYQGRGIIVIKSKSNKTGKWIGADGKRYEKEDLKDIVIRIMDGEYSLRNEIDTAFFEQRIITHRFLAPYAYQGLPDIRVIVYNKVPVMAELRLPTKASEGKANLHRGGIIVGIDMAAGRTTTAVQYDNIIETHPDNGKILSGIKIPYWSRVLELAVQSQIVTEIGFLGADIVIDEKQGPMVMELNARPGLGIQIANQDGLRGRLRRVKGLKIKTIERGVNVAKSLFGGDVEESIEEISGKQLIGTFENAKFFHTQDDTSILVKVKNDTGAYSTSISYDIAQKLGLDQVLEYFNNLSFDKKNLTHKRAKIIQKKWNLVAKENLLIEKIVVINSSNGVSIRPVVLISFEMSGIKVETRATIQEREGLRYPIIIGRRDLRKFLIDTSKK